MYIYIDLLKLVRNDKNDKNVETNIKPPNQNQHQHETKKSKFFIN